MAIGCSVDTSGLAGDGGGADGFVTPGVDARVPPGVDAFVPPGFDAGPPTDAGSDEGSDAGEVDAGPMRVDAGPPSGIPSGCGASPPFSDGFEGGSFPSPWTGTYDPGSDSVGRTSDVARTGGASARCNTDDSDPGQATMYLNVTPRDRIYVRFFAMIEDDILSRGFLKLAAVVHQDTSWHNIATINVFPDLRVHVRHGYSGTIHPTAAHITIDSWHEYELWVTISRTDGEIALDVDGVPALSLTGLDTGPRTIERVLTGIAWQEPPGDADPMTVYLDDVVIDWGCGP